MEHRYSPRVLALAATLGWCAAAAAQVPELFKDANPAQGEKLIAEHKCDACHAQKWTNDGKAIYRPGKSVTTATQLRSKVDQCNAGVGANLFPEEVLDIAASLNRSFYHFKH